VNVPALEHHPPSRRVLTTLLAVALGLVAWGLFADLYVPRLIESVYRHGGHPALESLINRYDPENTLDYYLGKWRLITWAGYGLLIGAPLAIPLLRSETFYRRCVTPTGAESLGVIRVFVCGMLLIYALTRNIVGTAELPWDLAQPMGLLTLLESLPIGYGAAVKSAAFLRGLHVATILVVFLAMIGLWTRVSLLLATGCVLIFGGLIREYTHHSHPFLMSILLLCFLNFTPCGASWSVDRLRRIWRNDPVVDATQPAPVYSWSRYICWAIVALPYTISGLHKVAIGGLNWWMPSNLEVNIISSQMNDHGDWLFGGAKPVLSLVQSMPDALLAAMALVALSVEVFYVSVLFLRPARFVILPLASLMHIGIFVFQKFLFLDSIFMALIFVDFTWLRRKWAARLKRKHGTAAATYNGEPQAAASLVRYLRGLDVFERLEWREAAQLPGAEPKGTGGAAAASIVLASRGETYTDQQALVEAVRYLPLVRPLRPLLLLPGAATFVFRRLCRKQAGNFESQAPATAAADRFAIPAVSPAGRRPGIAFIVVSGFAVSATLLSGVGKIEKYPFTAWNLFSGRNPHPVAATWKLKQITRDGTVREAEPGEVFEFFAYEDHQDMVLYATIEGRKQDFRTFLNEMARRYNAGRPPEKQVVRYRLEFWRWEYEKYPAGPHLAKLQHTIEHEVPGAGAGAEDAAADSLAGE